MATRHTPYVTISGYTKSVSAWLQEVGMSYETYSKRIAAGMTQEQAISTPQTEEEAMDGIAEWHNLKGPKAKKKVYKFIRNGGGAGTWREVEVEVEE